ncbi:outer membrane protein assembly factor BamE [Spongiibacter sp.]|uniref:outer membrane protein assembly factor BamE n=1 Tax=Spongiibacter sp. TaxID=2024860 RepID=UPI003563E31D
MFLRIATASLLLLLSACSSLEFPGVYRLPIDQGNIVTQEMVDQLEIGMSRSQVEYVMGSPLIRDSFNPDRWDYVYTLNQDGKPAERNQLSAFFEGDTLVRIVTDVSPSAEGKIGTQSPAPEATPEPAKDPQQAQ